MPPWASFPASRNGRCRISASSRRGAFRGPRLFCCLFGRDMLPLGKNTKETEGFLHAEIHHRHGHRFGRRRCHHHVPAGAGGAGAGPHHCQRKCAHGAGYPELPDERGGGGSAFPAAGLPGRGPAPDARPYPRPERPWGRRHERLRSHPPQPQGRGGRPCRRCHHPSRGGEPR